MREEEKEVSQISFYDGEKPFKITKPIRLIELFAGIGAQAKALTGAIKNAKSREARQRSF